MEAKHTALPWMLSGFYGSAVYGANGNMVAAVYGDATDCSIDERMTANSEFIVRACNAFPDLVEALKTMEMALIGYVHQNDVTKNALSKCREALTKAEQK